MIVIRYLLIILLVIHYTGNYTQYSIIYLLVLFLFTINNQLRFFCFNSTKLRFLSLLLDFIILIYIYNTGQVYFSIYFLLTGIDAVLFLHFKDMCLYNILLLIEMFVLYRNENWLSLLINGTIFFIFILMTHQLNIEHLRAKEAHSLYDKLRIKEEQLLVLNKELEGYAGTVESLTLLRERNRITREIHDNLGHRLSTSIIQLGAIEKMIAINPDKATLMVEYLREYNQESLQNVREVINELKPAEFEVYEGLLTIEQLIHGFKKLTGVQVNMNIIHSETDVWKLNETQTFAIYRIIQEFLSNSLRHGNAEKIEIILHFRMEQLILSLRDNGVGSDGIVEGNGIKHMRQRVNEIGGELQYETATKQGFFIMIQLPKMKGLPL